VDEGKFLLELPDKLAEGNKVHLVLRARRGEGWPLQSRPEDPVMVEAVDAKSAKSAKY
jgi:hypothetical protein